MPARLSRVEAIQGRGRGRQECRGCKVEVIKIEESSAEVINTE